jgi:hypothetical protein
LVKTLEDQKEGYNKEINELKAKIDEARKAFSKKMEVYD